MMTEQTLAGNSCNAGTDAHHVHAKCQTHISAAAAKQASSR